MPVAKEPCAEPIPGYRLVEPLGSGGFGEVWKCEAPGGLCKAIKFVYGNLDGLAADSAQAEEELEAIQRIKAIRHPFLLSMDRVESIGGELVIVTELADKNLNELLLERQKAGLPGIPRGELLGYLREAAEVLDLMNLQYGLQHLDVKPRNLFLVSNHVKVADFGLVNSLGGGAKLGAVTPLYAAPEVFLGKISPRSDQYSLAVVYQELLTGTLPFQGKNSRQLLLLHTTAEPDLRLLSDEDRPLVARAMAKEPEKRFPSCMEFIRALLGTAAEPVHERAPTTREPRAVPQASSAATDTVRNHKGDTDPLRQRPAIAHPAPAVPGYRLVESVGCSPLADVWKAERPDGKPCLVRLVYGLSGRDRRDLEDAIVRLKALRHPGLNPMEVVQNDPGRLVLVSDLIEETVRDRWQRCQTQRLPGIPRLELLEYLRTVAEAVDYLYRQHAIHHLGLNPRNLLLDEGRLQVAEFGLAHLFWVPAGQSVAQRNTRYAAPELFDGQVSRTSDQYSLALIYQEMLTGTHPFRGQTRQTSGADRGKVKPDVSLLPPSDRDVIARALDADPGRRWPSCTEMVRALEGELAAPAADERPRDLFVESLRTVPSALPPTDAGVSQDALNQILGELIASAGGDLPAEAGAASPEPLPSGDGLRHRFRAGLPIGAARLQLDAFRRRWDGQLLRDDEEGFGFQVSVPTNFWRQWIGRQPALEVQIQLSRPHALSATPIDVNVEVRALHCSKKRTARLLQEVGAPLLENLHAHLLTNSEKRTQDRLLWPYPVQVRCVLPDGKLSEPIECRGKDISLSGIGFYLPHEIPTSQVCVNLPTTLHPPHLSVPATLVRANRCADGWYDVGALFRLATLRKSLPDLCHK